MEKFAGELQQLAIAIANEMAIRKLDLKRELAALDLKSAAILASIELIDESVQRLRRLKPVAGDMYQCPYCWVRSGTISPLHTIPSSTDADIFGCDQCKQEIATE